MTATLAHPLDRAIEYLTDHRACKNCDMPVNDQMHKSWVHTLTGLYACRPSDGSRGGGDGFADPYDPDAAEDALQTAWEEGYEEGKDIAREEDCDQCPEELDKGVAEGRAAMSADLNGAITAALHRFRAGLTDAENDVVDRLNEALTEAWNGVEV